MTKTEYTVTGMTCEHCERAVAEEVGAIDGIEVKNVNAESGKLVVSSKSEVDDAAIVAAVREAGYSAARN